MRVHARKELAGSNTADCHQIIGEQIKVNKDKLNEVETEYTNKYRQKLKNVYMDFYDEIKNDEKIESIPPLLLSLIVTSFIENYVQILSFSIPVRNINNLIDDNVDLIRLSLKELIRQYFNENESKAH